MILSIILSVVLNSSDARFSVSEKQVVQTEDTCNICIPNTFNLKADSNALFYPYGKELIWYKMEIRSRWGDVVFKGKENQPWNGRDKKGNRLPTGMYNYTITVIDRDGRKEEKVGVFNLYR